MVRGVVKKERHFARSKPRQMDWQSVYLWLDYDMQKGEELFINYGKKHPSSLMFARYGFIDEVSPHDFVMLHLNFEEGFERVADEVDLEEMECVAIYNVRYLGTETLRIEPDVWMCLRVLVMATKLMEEPT